MAGMFVNIRQETHLPKRLQATQKRLEDLPPPSPSPKLREISIFGVFSAGVRSAFPLRCLRRKADFATVVAVAARHTEIKLLALTDHDAIGASVALAAVEPRPGSGRVHGFRGERRMDILGLNLRQTAQSCLNIYLRA